MAHRVIIMRENGEQVAETEAADRHQNALEEAVRLLAEVGPRFFRTMKIQAIRKMEIPDDVKEMGESQMFVLHALNNKTYLASELARLHNVTNPTMTRIVDGLVEKGYVERRHDIEDRRCIFLQLTESGKQVGRHAEQCLHEAALQLLQPLTTEQLVDIKKAYRHLASLLPNRGQESEQIESGKDGADVVASGGGKNRPGTSL